RRRGERQLGVGARGEVRADDHVDVVRVEQLTCGCRSGRGVALIVLGDDLHRAAVDRVVARHVCHGVDDVEVLRGGEFCGRGQQDAVLDRAGAGGWGRDGWIESYAG